MLADQMDTLLKVFVVTALVVIIWRTFRGTRTTPSLRSAAVLVLGDVGRSPRMMYHAESLAENGFETFVIGNRGSKPVPSLMSIPHVHFLYLPNAPKPIPGIPFVVNGPWKVLRQVVSILNVLLFRIPRPPEFIVVQNPPSIPTLALVWIVSLIRGSKVIIDWHNLGYSILALKLGDQHFLVKIAKWFESYFGRVAYAHLFVTNAMHDYLVREWSLKGQKAVLHDRPPSHFHRASPSEMHELSMRLEPTLTMKSLQSFLPNSDPPHSTAFTQIPPSSTDPNPTQRSDRPALLVSSTSWTPDEDFSILLEALQLYEVKAREARGALPKVLMVVTGKGPEREKYMWEVEKLQSGKGSGGDESAWEWVRCVSMWLEPEDYPVLLGSADLGISLHSSSSALDLPMKVVDMFGCGLPVCALNFACLDELVKDGVNGLVFDNAEQLANQMQYLLQSFPRSSTLAGLSAAFNTETQSGTAEWQWGTWQQNWNLVMRPLLLSDVSADMMGPGE
ncbi:mannosyltransferase [Steccherinum ochraceum]|uniref:Chitobiosyldiphosphodolichol beta-mannosyltransferase n=1 Tax=Steccherinum ochraceum TaxID=92696 RepID=A0A4V2MVJ8_9APHY|nr:mannosyltransferase [Steccherinum ochraceum]